MVTKADSQAARILFSRQILSPKTSIPANIEQIFMKKEETSDAKYYSRTGLGIFGKAVIVCIVIMILLTPIALLYLLKLESGQAIAVVITFVIIFAIGMPVLANPAIETLLIGTCTYCAVLVTFLAISGSTT